MLTFYLFMKSVIWMVSLFRRGEDSVMTLPPQV